MLEKHENEVYHQMMILAQGSGQHHALSAYPHLQALFFEQASNMQNLTNMFFQRHREELFYGLTPWAMLYKLQTGRDIKLPTPAIVKYLADSNRVEVSPIPIKEIARYAKSYRLDKLPASMRESERWGHSFKKDTVTVDISLADQSATISWDNNDMYLNMPDFGASRAEVHCPLFHAPYTIHLEHSFLNSVLYDPLVDMLIGDEAITLDFESKYLLMDHYFGTRQEPKELPTEHPFVQLRHLLNTSSYGKAGKSTIRLKVNNDYSIAISATRDWNFHESLVVKIDSAYRHYEKDGEMKEDSIWNSTWEKNPLFVRDIIANLPRMIDEALAEHERQLAGTDGYVAK
ncbi:hypothetical protein PA10_00164 [Pseudomonas phage pPa_SNUABM_DT01]|nr:hypothetical protein PA10_00164 [Pseudomonas phage pPa_SNUABM_DT01]